MSILSAETEAMIRERAAQTGRTPDELVKLAISNLPDGKRGYLFPSPSLTPEERRQKVEEIAKRHAARPIIDHRTDEEIIGFDENGLPA